MQILCFRPSSQNPVELVSPPRIPSNAEEALTMDVQIKNGTSYPRWPEIMRDLFLSVYDTCPNSKSDWNSVSSAMCENPLLSDWRGNSTCIWHSDKLYHRNHLLARIFLGCSCIASKTNWIPPKNQNVKTSPITTGSCPPPLVPAKVRASRIPD